jgi:DNA repair protein RecO
MHHIFHTEAVVLGTYVKAESDKLVTLYTKEFGLVRADARGMRNMRSKLRFSLQPYSIVQLDMISTKGGWRVGSVRSVTVPSGLSIHEYSTLYKISKLVSRLCAGEEKNEALYKSLVETLTTLFEEKTTTTTAHTIELVAVLRILFHLGYITGDIASPFIDGPLTTALLESAGATKKRLLETINHSLRETML